MNLRPSQVNGPPEARRSLSITRSPELPVAGFTLPPPASMTCSGDMPQRVGDQSANAAEGRAMAAVSAAADSGPAIFMDSPPDDDAMLPLLATARIVRKGGRLQCMVSATISSLLPSGSNSTAP